MNVSVDAAHFAPIIPPAIPNFKPRVADVTPKSTTARGRAVVAANPPAIAKPKDAPTKINPIQYSEIWTNKILQLYATKRILFPGVRLCGELTNNPLKLQSLFDDETKNQLQKLINEKQISPRDYLIHHVLPCYNCYKNQSMIKFDILENNKLKGEKIYSSNSKIFIEQQKKKDLFIFYSIIQIQTLLLNLKNYF